MTLVGDGPWIRVVTRLEPSGQVALHQFADHLKFSRSPDWSFSAGPSLRDAISFMSMGKKTGPGGDKNWRKESLYRSPWGLCRENRAPLFNLFYGQGGLKLEAIHEVLGPPPR